MSQTMQYGGHGGHEESVLYRVGDKLLHGRLSGIRDLVIYDAEDGFIREKDFLGAFYEAQTKTPNKPFKGSLDVRLREDLYLRAARLADELHCKLNAVSNVTVHEYLAQAS